jgi:hypothetical protein
MRVWALVELEPVFLESFYEGDVLPFLIMISQHSLTYQNCPCDWNCTFYALKVLSSEN